MEKITMMVKIITTVGTVERYVFYTAVFIILGVVWLD
jgi:hypothetical protein